MKENNQTIPMQILAFNKVHENANKKVPNNYITMSYGDRITFSLILRRVER